MIHVGATVLWSRGLEDDYGPRETKAPHPGRRPSEPGNAIGRSADGTAKLTSAATEQPVLGNPGMKEERCAQSGGGGTEDAHAVNAEHDTARVFYSRAHGTCYWKPCPRGRGI